MTASAPPPSIVPPPPRPPSPTGSITSTARSTTTTTTNNNNNSPRPSIPTHSRKSYRRPSSTNGNLIRSTSNSSISRLDVDGGTATTCTASTPRPSPNNNNNIDKDNDNYNNDKSNKIYSSNSNNTTTNINDNDNTIQPDPINPKHRQSLPHPLPPSKCPLLCVFYAEFDIVVGPKVCFQSPNKFMHFDIDAISEDDIHNSLRETFDAVIDVIPTKDDDDGEEEEEKGDTTKTLDGKEQDDHQELETAKAAVANILSNKEQQSDGGTDNTPPTPKGYVSQSQQDTDEYWHWSPNTRKRRGGEQRNGDNTTDDAANHVTTKEKQPSHRRKQSGVSVISTDESNNNQPTQEGGDNSSTIDTTEFLQANSIFASTSEYIITGNELANQTITVSTHGMHILSRPSIIQNTQRYERNSLLFAVGFVLRRNVDPRPYWPVLSNVSSTLCSMEVESEFLSHHRTRSQIQIVLEDILVSLNSKQRDCHLLLNDANLLNLYLFRPPPPPTPPVPDYAVPILLRPEWQLQMYDWDLTINYIIPQIDGCKYVTQIANSIEVDMEMVRACLRVLRHHGVLAYVDVFQYSNVYEWQDTNFFSSDNKTTTMDKKKANNESNKLLDAAFWYCVKSKYVRRAQQRDVATSNIGDDNSPKHSISSSPSPNLARKLNSHMSSLHSLDLSLPKDGAGATITKQRTSLITDESMSFPRSFPSRTTGNHTIREEHSMDEEEDTTTSVVDHDPFEVGNSSQLKEINTMKNALAQLYCSCSRNETFGQVLLAKMKDTKVVKQQRRRSSSIENSVAQSFVDSTLTPLRESSDVPKMEDRVENNGDTVIDWRLVFDYFDHRRLVTFGLIKGIIKRVHQFPLAYEIRTENCKNNSGRETSVEDTDLDNTYQIEISAIAKEVSAEATKIAVDEMSRSTSYSNSQGYASSPLLPALSSPRTSSADGILLNKLTEKEVRRRTHAVLMERISLAMDGTRCDDELSCMFELPVEQLIEMLQSTGRWDVISVYSCMK